MHSRPAEEIATNGMMHDDSPAMDRAFGRWAFVLYLLATLAGAVVCLLPTTGREFWYDECCTYLYVRDLFHWPAGLANLLRESTNLPYYVLLKVWAALFGNSEVAYRSMSGVAAVLTVPLIGAATARLGGRRAGWIAAALAATSPLLVYYAHEARAYALWMLLLSATLLALLQAVHHGTPRTWGLYGALLLVTLPTHYFTVFWIPASASVVLLAADRRRVLRAWSHANVMVVLLFVPYVVMAVLPAGAGGGNRWIGASFHPATAVLDSLWAMLPAGRYPPHLTGLSASGAVTPLVIGSQVAAVALTFAAIIRCLLTLRARRHAPRDVAATEPRASARANATSGKRSQSAVRASPDPAAAPDATDGAHRPIHHPLLVAAALTLGPLLLAWIYSIVVRPIYFAGRYDLVAWPGFIMLLALVLDAPLAVRDSRARLSASRGRQRAQWLIVAGLLSVAAVPLSRFTTSASPPELTEHRMRAERLAELASVGDCAMTFSYDREFLSYHLDRAGFRGLVWTFPSWLDDQLGWLDTAADLADPARLEEDAERVASWLYTFIEGKGGTVWWLKDSQPPESARMHVNAYLERRLRDAGFTLTPASPEYRIYRLEPPPRK